MRISDALRATALATALATQPALAQETPQSVENILSSPASPSHEEVMSQLRAILDTGFGPRGIMLAKFGDTDMIQIPGAAIAVDDFTRAMATLKKDAQGTLRAWIVDTQEFQRDFLPEKVVSDGNHPVPLPPDVKKWKVAAGPMVGNTMGSGLRAMTLYDGQTWSIGGEIVTSTALQSYFLAMGFRVTQDITGTFTVSAVSQDAAKALGNPEYRGNISAYSASIGLNYRDAFIRFLHERGLDTKLNERHDISTTVSTVDMLTYFQTTTTTVDRKTVTLWDGFARNTLLAGYRWNIGENWQLVPEAGASNDPINGTRGVGGATLSYYGGTWKASLGAHTQGNSRVFSASATGQIDEHWNIEAHIGYVPGQGSASSSTFGGIMAEYDSLPHSPDTAQRFVRPNADGSTPTPAQAVESAIDNPILKANPTTLGEKREVVTTDTRNTTTTTDKSPEVIDPTSIHTVINPDKSVTVSFSPRAGWSYEYRLDSGTWNTVSGASFTTGILTLGAHTLSLREKNPRNNAVGTPTSVSLNITNPNQNPNAFSAIAPVNVIAGTASNTTLPTTTDPDGNPLTYSIVGTLPTGFSFNATTRVLSWTVGTTVGTSPLSYKADDGNGGSTTTNFSINVVAAPADHAEVVTLPTPTITATAITFAGGSVTDSDNPGGFTPTISYIVTDTSGNPISASSLTPNTAYAWQMQYTTYDGATNTLTVKKTVKQNFTTLAPADTTAPSLTSSPTLSASNIGTTVSHTLTFDEAINTVSVGVIPTGMTVTATKSGSSVTLDIATTASFTGFGSVTIPLTVTDNASPANSRTVNINKTINDVAPTGPALADITINDNGGGLVNFVIPINTGVSNLGRTVNTVVTGFPANDDNGAPTTFTVDVSGNATVGFDSNAAGNITIPLTVTTSTPGSSLTLIRTLNLIIVNNG